MKKHTYRLTDIKQVDWLRVVEQAEGKSLVFGVDVAKKDFVGLLSTREKEPLARVKWSHPEESGMLLSALVKFPGLEVALEPTGSYGDALRWQLESRGIKVYRVNPKHTHDYSESFDGWPGLHDAKAAQVITELHLHGRSSRWEALTEARRGDQCLLMELGVHQQSQQSNRNRLSALMARHWPELGEVTGLDTLSVLSLLQAYGSAEAVQANAEDADALLQRIGRSGLKADKRRAIVASAQDSLGMPCTQGECEHIQWLAGELIRDREACAAVERRMAQRVGEDAVLTAVAEVTGKTSCIALSALLGELGGYRSPASLVKAAGLNLMEQSSGQHKGQLKITKRGAGKSRFYLYWLALRLIRTDANINAWYERKVARDGGQHKGRAIVAVMRKVLKALWHVAQGETFDSSKLFRSASQEAAMS